MSPGGIDIVILKLVGIEPIALFDLGDHLVGAVRHTEVVHITAAEHGPDHRTNVPHGQAELGR